MAAADPAIRSLSARIAAHSRWSKEDRREGTKAATAGHLAKFERQVDPDGQLTPDERRERAESARRAHMLSLALRSAAARARRAAA